MRWREALLPPFLDANVRIVLAARTAMSAARAIAGVVTALYLTAIGFSAVELGLLFVAVSLTSALASAVIGLASDRFGRRPFLIAVPLLAAVAGALFAEVRAPAALFVLASLGTFGRGAGAGGGSVGPYQPAESALVGEAVARKHRAAAFGRISFASSLGALAGGLLSNLAHPGPHLAPAAAAAAYRPAFLAAAALAFVAGALAFGISEPERPARERPGRRIVWPRRSFAALWRLWVANGTNGIAIGAFGPFLSYWLYRRYGAGPAAIGDLFAVVNFATLASALAAAGVARRVGTVRAIVTVRALAGALLVPMVLSPTFALAAAIYVVRMLAQRIGLPLRQSYTQDLAHPDERGSVAALATLPAQATMAGSQVVAGYLFEEVSLAAPFELAAFFQAANAFLYWYLFTRRPPRPSVEAGGEAAGDEGADRETAAAEPGRSRAASAGGGEDRILGA